MGAAKPKSSLSSQVADQLGAQIAAGRYRPNDALPTVQALSEEFGVSEGTVRTALSELDHRGLTQGRQGRPRLVLAPDLKAGSLPEVVAGRIRQAISDGTYAAGTELPNEQDLAAEFRVSRHTIRGALTALEAEGAVIHPAGRRRQVPSTEPAGLTKYERILAALRSRIASGEYAPKSALPSEPELSQEFDASRAPVRRALAELEKTNEVVRDAHGARVVRGNA